MKRKLCLFSTLLTLMVLLGAGQALSAGYCPNDDVDLYPFGWSTGGAKGTEDFDKNGDGTFNGDPDIICMDIAAGDGFVNMADSTALYIFGFSKVPFGMPENQIVDSQTLKQGTPAPTIVLKEGQEFYLNLSNVGMMMRPDLSDPHSVHYHGFPNAAPVFDGLPEASPTIKMFNTYTYYYKNVEPGTYFYHCHVEATEHIQMGMIGNLWVLPAQDGTDFEYPPASGKHYTRFAYNDGDGSTGYDVAFAIQLTAFDSNFHKLHLGVQPLPFADLDDDYHMLNGRGYPDTINPGELGDSPDNNSYPSQKMNARIEATSGQKILLRLSGVQTVHPSTVTVLGIPMQVVGIGARILRGPDNKNLYYNTSAITVGGGQGYDVLLDTTGVTPGTYFFYATNPETLVNGTEDRGGAMTEIVIN